MSPSPRTVMIPCPCIITLLPHRQIRLQVRIPTLVSFMQTSGELQNSTADRRGSLTPSIARSEEADGAVIMGYAEPQAFRVLRRENEESSSRALDKALKDDPTLKSLTRKSETAPSRRPTALGVPNMQ